MSNFSLKRKQIIELLQLFASEEQQLAYERDVPHVDITTELVCLWFDDLYHPRQQDFATGFTAEELAVLAEFHRLFDERVDRLPESPGTVRTWLASPIWREVMEQAQRMLERVAA